LLLKDENEDEYENKKPLGLIKINFIQIIEALINDDIFMDRNDLIDILLIYFEVMTELFFKYEKHSILQTIYCKSFSKINQKKMTDLMEYVFFSLNNS
jgi:hypothetical protein